MAIRLLEIIGSDHNPIDVFDTFKAGLTYSLTMQAPNTATNLEGQVFFDSNYKSLNYITDTGKSNYKNIWTTDYTWENALPAIYAQRTANSGQNHSPEHFLKDLTIYQTGKSSADLNNESNQLVTMDVLKQVLLALAFFENSPRNYNSEATISAKQKPNGTNEQFSSKPGGLTIKKGLYSDVNPVNTKKRVTFTKAFDNQCMFVLFSPFASKAGKTEVYLDEDSNLNDKEGFTFYVKETLSNNRVSFLWFAIGF
ncbi:hypothetical protein CKF54_00830 [Psittacicella hinzii]|uniref:Putative tail fiber protein gp53-like C-terminal domain-containing protein n=1 Tax=Psittacicella hinzii TaxID=2028575 RepID=A0A3A1YDV9_9GAMM|nr:hypothetical protein [Psittacicella hinzii]RIY34317.1 hypothetical protein CKF54_00830 [Psittacicella hinzii]